MAPTGKISTSLLKSERRQKLRDDDIHCINIFTCYPHHFKGRTDRVAVERPAGIACFLLLCYHPTSRKTSLHGVCYRNVPICAVFPSDRCNILDNSVCFITGVTPVWRKRLQSDYRIYCNQFEMESEWKKFVQMRQQSLASEYPDANFNIVCGIEASRNMLHHLTVSKNIFLWYKPWQRTVKIAQCSALI